ncbi:hypothetical protein [Amycolatopsis sp. SID8362]|uniref:hypothetical protein n=1 Tax=Amycolatopsis sp. SID8362 TaxID=2690346 RepID=UPI00136A3466|nr:hypothetical protein [Amycolatopsis sp. SID8362]NBH05258.1 hypothetical protein [Amycolatopsis sp. SID8362]NED41958.1 hypothetical protein [Amycolatopsis sp. SID8362]
MRPVPGLAVIVDDTGVLEMVLPTGEHRVLASGLGAAMWIALAQHDWDPAAAALALAPTCDLEPAELTGSLRAWMGDLVALGVLSADAADGKP